MNDEILFLLCHHFLWVWLEGWITASREVVLETGTTVTETDENSHISWQCNRDNLPEESTVSQMVEHTHGMKLHL
jgi:hypothetical protein